MLGLSLKDFTARVDKIADQQEDLWNQRTTDALPTTDGWIYSEKPSVPFDGLMVRWKSRGVEGGNCWDDTSESYTNTDDPPEITGLHLILAEIFQDLPNIESDQFVYMIQEGEYYVSGYYGNFDIIKYRAISLSDFYEFLVNKHLIINPDVLGKTMGMF